MTICSVRLELTSTLVIAASESDDHLDRDEIDRLLGVSPTPPDEVSLPRPREQ